MLRRLLSIRGFVPVRRLATDSKKPVDWTEPFRTKPNRPSTLLPLKTGGYEVQTSTNRPLWRIPASFVDRYKTANDLPLSSHPFGYDNDEIKAIIGLDLWPDFEYFMIGQTVAIHPTLKKPLYYIADIMEFIRRKRGQPKDRFRMI